MQRMAAILTGDLVGSTKAGPDLIDHTFEILTDTANHLTQHQGESTRLSRFRGDGWQMFIDAPSRSLQSCIYIVARLRADGKALPTRIAAGIGMIERLPATALEQAFGEAPNSSGKCLDAMPQGKRLAIAGERYILPWHRAIFDLVEWQSSRWSPEQAEAVALSFDHENLPYRERGFLLGISRQAMQARLRSAGRSHLDEALQAFQMHRFTPDTSP